jgi:hypothetical protein
VGSRQNVNPKKDLRPPFSLVHFFWASKRTEQMALIIYPRQRNDKQSFASSPKANEQII